MGNVNEKSGRSGGELKRCMEMGMECREEGSEGKQEWERWNVGKVERGGI